MKPIKTTTTLALIALAAPLAAQAALSVPAPVTMSDIGREAGPATPVFLDLRQLESDLLVLLEGNGDNSRDDDRDDDSDDGNGDDSLDRNGDDDRNGGNSDGGNGGDS